LAPFRPPGWGSVGCRTFVELNLSGALDARHHLGDGGSVSGGACQLNGTPHIFRDKYLPRAVSMAGRTLTYDQNLVLAHPSGMTDN